MQDYNNLRAPLHQRLHGSRTEEGHRSGAVAVSKVRLAPPGLIQQINWLLGFTGGTGGEKGVLEGCATAPVWTPNWWPTGLWSPDLTGDQELNNLVSRDSNFPRSLQILQITDSTARHQIRSAHHKWSPVWVNNNYEWSCWFDLLWTFIWSIKAMVCSCYCLLPLTSSSHTSFIGKNWKINNVLLSAQLRNGRRYHPAGLLWLSGIIYLKVQTVYIPPFSLVVWDLNVPADLLLLLWNICHLPLLS